MCQVLNDLEFLCKEYSVLNAELAGKLRTHVTSGFYTKNSEIVLSQICDTKSLLMVSGTFYVFIPEAEGQPATRFIRALTKGHSICEILKDLPHGTILKAQSKVRILLLNLEDPGKLLEIPGMKDLTGRITSKMLGFKDSWANLIQTPDEKSLRKLFELFPGHNFKVVSLYNLYRMTHSTFNRKTKPFRTALLKEFKEKNKTFR